MLTMRRRIVLPAVLLAMALSLAGCSSSGGSGASSVGGAIAEPQPKTQDSSGGSTANGVVSDRQIITTGSVVIRTKDPIAAAGKAAQIVDQAGGRVDDRNQTAATATEPADASLTLRIPSSQLTQTLAELKSVGKELSITQSTDDVTATSEDLGARITALQTSVTRLLALEAKASKTSDLIELESDIADRQGQLESLTAQQRTLKDQVAMSTIKLHLIAPSTVIAKPGPPSAASAFFAGFSGFGLVFTWIFLVLTYLLPWLILGAVLWVGIVLFVRWRRRRAPVAPPAP